MKNLLQKGFIKYLLAFVAFVFISYAYAPQVLKGKIVNQSDISSWEGMSNEIVSYNKANPDDRTLWTNSMFEECLLQALASYIAETIQTTYINCFLQERDLPAIF